MKKIKIAFIALLVMGLGAGIVNAQDKTAAKKDAPAKQADKKPASGQHLKKDGTPDMRYKENKEAASDKKTTTKTSDTKPAKTEGTKTTTPAKSGGKKASAPGKTDKATTK